MIRIGVFGAGGRMGQQLINILRSDSSATLGAAIVRSRSPLNGTQIAGTDVRYESDLSSQITHADVWIDFSSPEGTLTLLNQLKGCKAQLLVCTTGHEQDAMVSITDLSEKIPVMIAPNTSLGVIVLREISKMAVKMLGQGFEPSIAEVHHVKKKDRPSGTALALKKDLSMNSEFSPPILSTRAGDVVGLHSVSFYGHGEELVLTHRATDRAIFARGALVLAKWLVGQGAGLFDPSDALLVGFRAE